MPSAKSTDKRFSKIEKRLKKIEKIIFSQKPPKKLGKEKKKASLTNAILDLRQESFFTKPKELKEIREALEAKAVFYPQTNYPDSLLRIVKSKKLRRLKQNNKWKYVNG